MNSLRWVVGDRVLLRTVPTGGIRTTIVAIRYSLVLVCSRSEVVGRRVFGRRCFGRRCFALGVFALSNSPLSQLDTMLPGLRRLWLPPLGTKPLYPASSLGWRGVLSKRQYGGALKTGSSGADCGQAAFISKTEITAVQQAGGFWLEACVLNDSSESPVKTACWQIVTYNNGAATPNWIARPRVTTCYWIN